jgi:hypothetical protein
MVALDPVVDTRRQRPPLSPLLFEALTVAATGGPLALVAIYVPGVLGDARGSAGLVVLLGVALFVPSLLIWLNYSRRVVGGGGLYSFVEAAAGLRVARVQAGLWVISYLLYVVYTVTYIVYDLLPSMFPSVEPARPALQIGVAVVLAAVALAPIRHAVMIIAVSAAVQLVLVATIVVTALTFPGGSPGSTGGSFGLHGSASDVLVAGANTSILFICASLPLFLGGEVNGGSTAVRRGLASGWAVVAAATVVGVVPLAAIGSKVLETTIPGMSLATQAGHTALADAIAIGILLSVGGVILAEFLALTRLGNALTGWPVSRLSRILALVVVGGSAVSLVNPDRVYDDLLKPSLVALWLAQGIVFAVYPRFVWRHGTLRARDVGLAVVATGLMAFGLWSTFVNQLVS